MTSVASPEVLLIIPSIEPKVREEHFEDVFCRSECRAASRASVSIVIDLLAFIAKDLVRLRYFLEPFVSEFFIVRVFVRMPLHCQFPERLLDFLLVGSPAQLQNLVVVPLYIHIHYIVYSAAQEQEDSNGIQRLNSTNHQVQKALSA